MNEIFNLWFKLSMPHFKFRRATLCATIGTLGLSFGSAHGMTMGELQLQSYIGQPFRGLVPYRLNAGEAINEQCIELRASNNELPGLGPATIQIRPNGELSGVLLIESRSAVGEPTIAFAVKFACANQQMTRDFTAFLNIAPLRAERETPSRMLPREVRPRRAESSNEQDVSPRTDHQLTLKKPMSLRELTKRYYPENTPQYPRYLQKLSANNPNLDPNAELSAGTVVSIPDKLRSVRKKSPTTPTVEAGQLRLDSEPSQRTKPTSTGTPSAAQYTQVLEEKVKTLEELQFKLQLEVEQLNARLSQLNTSASLPLASQPMASAPEALITASTVNTAAVNGTAAIAASQPHKKRIMPTPEVVEPESKTPAWLIGLGLVGIVTTVGGWLFWRRRQAQQSNELAPHSEQTLMGQFKTYATRHKTTEHTPTMMSFLHHPGAGIEVSDFDSVDLARIQIMLGQGEVAEAIDLLYRSIDEDPEDIERWLMLFRVFRQQGMKTEYANLAKNLSLIVKDEADWELVRNIGSKLDPENELYQRHNSPSAMGSAMGSAVGSTLIMPDNNSVELDIHPEPTPATMMAAFLDIETPRAPPAALDFEVSEAAPEIMLDIQLPEVHYEMPGMLFQATEEIEMFPAFEPEISASTAESTVPHMDFLDFDSENKPQPERKRHLE
ncbi:type IV pilus assembly protein FimV [Deefgea piscis]|uniref:type IV pilus assembly protein FimV n=1 Tax=Deefgea piscis TaxID=2739061 RepID=UPI001C7F7F77|nr:hypothetical protein [Deefgea piscis]QZA81515.1 hypothetical protein K4H25_02295 [Deefgea piscis]